MNKILKTFLVSGLVLSAASAAQAEVDMSVLFENTVVLTAVTADREIATNYHYNPDNTVHIVIGERDASGSWELKGDDLCTTFTSPQGQAQEMCAPASELTGATPGSTWEFSPAEGLTIKGELVAGR